jgi:hypothetical protein
VILSHSRWTKSSRQVKFLAAARDPQEKPIRIERTQDAWYWSPLSIRQTIVVHLVKTAA